MDSESDTEENVELLSLHQQHYDHQNDIYPQTRRSRISTVFAILKVTFLLISLVVVAWYLWFILPSILVLPPTWQPSSPAATTVNGTVSGVYSSRFDQDIYLGIPYAEPPLGGNRFRRAEPLKLSWQDTRPATSYGPHCLGYGDHQESFAQSEDCLTINIIRPRVTSHHSLPVGVYIYGGGTHGGGSGDNRYNMSYLVAHAAEVGLPFIGVSFNYRSSIWGFIAGKEVSGTGATNIGIHDQRTALRWVQENILSFGGNPSMVTIWGGSSGADSVGMHLTAYGGRDDGLFRAAIMQSGGPVVATSLRKYTAQEAYNQVVALTGCTESDDSLKCLRSLSLERINAAFNNSAQATSQSMAVFSKPVIDGDLMRRFGSVQLRDGDFVNVPVLIGTVSSEAATWIPEKISSWEDLEKFLIDDCGYSASSMKKLLDMYPNMQQPGRKDQLVPPIGSIPDAGTFERVKNILGDIELNASQRLTCQTFSIGAGCYSFRFDALPAWTIDPRIGVPHGAEIAPLFQNLDGIVFDEQANDKDAQGYTEMSKLMGTMWAGFITALDPNAGLKESQTWPVYSHINPQNFVFNASGSGMGWSEEDTYRSEAIEYVNTVMAGVFGK